MNLKKKSIICLSLLSLVSCNNVIGDTSDTSLQYRKNLENMLSMVASGVSLESLVTLNQTMKYSNLDDQKNTYYFYLDTQTTNNEYSYQQYQESENLVSINRDTITASGNIIEDSDGLAKFKFLGINNVNYYYSMTQENIKGEIEEVKWNESGLSNFFSDLSADMFDCSLGEFNLKVNEVDENILKHISSCIFGENTVPFVSQFRLEAENGKLKSYHIETRTQQRYDTSSGASYELQYVFDGEITGYGDDDENVTKNFLNPLVEDEDETFSNMMNKLKLGNYQENVKTYQTASINSNGTLVSNTNYYYSDKTTRQESCDEKNNVLSIGGYYIDNEGYIQRVVNVGTKGFYNQGQKLTSNNSNFASFDISSLFFDKASDGLYVYNNSTSKAQLFPTSFFTLGNAESISYATIKINNDKVEITSYIPQVSSEVSYFIKMVCTYTNIGSTNSNINIKEVSDGDSLTWDDYFSGDEYLSIAKEILGEDLFYNISPIGGVYNEVSLYASKKDSQVQMQYSIGLLNDFDLDRDDSLSTTEQYYLYLYVYSILKGYDSKLKLNFWDSKKYDYLSGSIYTGITLEKKYNDENNYLKKMTFDIYFTYDQSTFESYIVFDITDKNVYNITFDLNYEGCTNITKVLLYGDSVKEEYVYRKGYIFEGWYYEKECINKVDMSKEKVTKDITYYAKWSIE